MRKLLRLLGSPFGRFLVAGGIAAAANYGSRFAFSLWLAYAWAIVCAYIVGMIVAFVLMRTLVFDARDGRLGPQMAKFTAVNLFAVLQTLVISIALVRWVFGPLEVPHAQAIAHLIGVLFPIGTSYIGHKLVTFR
jgi:putative flippase GtrA